MMGGAMTAAMVVVMVAMMGGMVPALLGHWCAGAGVSTTTNSAAQHSQTVPLGTRTTERRTRHRSSRRE